MSLSFITSRTESILTKKEAKFPSAKYNVPNAHKCFDDEQVTVWKQIADCLGIDFEDTGYTLRVVTKGQERSIYTPYIASDGSQAIIVWGKVKKPLSELNKDLVELSIGGGKRPAIELFLAPLDDTLVLTLMFAKGDKEDSTKEQKDFIASDSDSQKNTLRKALRNNKLHQYLSLSFEEAKKLSDVAGQTLTVIGYSVNNSQWGEKFELVTKEAGNVKANSAIEKKLRNKPVITEEIYATLEVSAEPIKFTSEKKPIYGTTLLTYADRELPVFDFGGTEENVEPEYDFVA